jgi:hypothetical protein
MPPFQNSLLYTAAARELMHRIRHLIAVNSLLCAALPLAAFSQSDNMPRDYRGVEIRIPGIFVTPVPNAPFSAKVDIVSQEKLPDGSLNIRTSTAHVARQSSGRIYNELRALVPSSFKGDPPLLSAHIYDPTTHLNIFLNPNTRLARESIFQRPPAPPPNSVPGRIADPSVNPSVKEEDLGMQSIGTTLLRGIRKSRSVPADQSGTGKQIVIVDEYWYSPDLSIYLIIKHNDPRTGEQIVAVSEIDRHEPDASLFAVPTKYKVVDENPPAD